MKKRIFKTKEGIEIKSSIKKGDTDITHYYAWYSFDKDKEIWKVTSNVHLYKDSNIEIKCHSKEEAIKIANSINKFIYALTENI
jgi:hypothetical protein